ncbi:hypothetical protein [Pseudomonas phage vB_Pae_CF183b]|nr:hypothetical protein [Pseudomonas phage vB_Pae_CF183b]
MVHVRSIRNDAADGDSRTAELIIFPYKAKAVEQVERLLYTGYILMRAIGGR